MPDIVNDLMKGAIIGVAAVGVQMLMGGVLGGFGLAGSLATVAVVSLGYAVAKMVHIA